MKTCNCHKPCPMPSEPQCSTCGGSLPEDDRDIMAAFYALRACVAKKRGYKEEPWRFMEAWLNQMLAKR